MPKATKRKSTTKDEDFENIDPAEDAAPSAKKRKTKERRRRITCRLLNGPPSRR